MSELKDLIDARGAAAEVVEAEEDSPKRTDVRVTRGHDRARTLQIRLNEDELAELMALAEDRGLPVSTVACQLLLQSWRRPRARFCSTAWICANGRP